MNRGFIILAIEVIVKLKNVLKRLIPKKEYNKKGYNYNKFNFKRIY